MKQWQENRLSPEYHRARQYFADKPSVYIEDYLSVQRRVRNMNNEERAWFKAATDVLGEKKGSKANG